MKRARNGESLNPKIDYEFVSAAKKDAPKTTNANDPLYEFNFKKVNSFQKEFREFAAFLEGDGKTAKKFTWTRRATGFFLKRCLDKKEKFLDSEQDKSLWTDILEQMNSVGYHVKSEEDLILKMDQLRKKFEHYNEKHKESNGTIRIVWPYFEQFKELLYEDCSAMETTLNPLTSSSKSEYIEDIGEEETIEFKPNTLNRASGSIKRNYVKSRQLYIKEKKAEMAEKILETLDETNRLQEERNNLIFELISMRKARKTSNSQNQIKLNLDDINFNNILQLNEYLYGYENQFGENNKT